MGLCLFVLFALCSGRRGSGGGECGGAASPPIVEHSNTTKPQSEKKALYLRLYSFVGIVILLQLIKPSICPQIELHEKTERQQAKKERKTPHDGGAILFYQALYIIS